MYEQTLALTETHRYFCVLNNMGRHENKFSLDDMRYLDSIMIDSGITEFYGVTISHDPAYTGIIELASASAQSLALKNDLWTTPDPIEAELFIMRKLALPIKRRPRHFCAGSISDRSGCHPPDRLPEFPHALDNSLG